MSDLREIVKIINQIARDNSESNSKEGEVVKLNDNGTHNVKLTEENGVEYIIPNRWPDDGKSKYPAGTRVILTLPDGSLDRSVIRGNANFNLPSSPTVKHFSTAPIVPSTTVYLYLLFDSGYIAKCSSVGIVSWTKLNAVDKEFIVKANNKLFLSYLTAVSEYDTNGEFVEKITNERTSEMASRFGVDSNGNYIYQIYSQARGET